MHRPRYHVIVFIICYGYREGDNDHRQAQFGPCGGRCGDTGRVWPERAGAHVKCGRKFETVDSVARSVRFTQDDAFLLLDSPLSGDQITEILDAVSLDSVATLMEWYPWLGRDLAGAPIVLSSKSVEETTRFAVFDPETPGS